MPLLLMTLLLSTPLAAAEPRRSEAGEQPAPATPETSEAAGAAAAEESPASANPAATSAGSPSPTSTANADRAEQAPPPESTVIYEPPTLYQVRAGREPVPPPPIPHHRAPRYALLVGARLGWLLPEGDLWARGEPFASDWCCRYWGEDWSEYAGSAAKFELNIGARISRYYGVFGIWEHARFSAGDNTADYPDQDGGYSNFYGIGFRFSTDPNRVGLLVEIAAGARKFHADLGDGSELYTDATLNTRLGLGADIRLSRYFTLTPMLTLAGGAFSDVILETDAVGKVDQVSGLNAAAQHIPISFEVGGVFDVFGSE